jgi:hypothetical protein
MPAHKPINAGQKFHMLTAVEPSARGRIFFTFKCDCGTLKEISISRVRTGQCRSCGCLQRNAVAALKLRHGGSGTAEFSVWRNMLDRCFNSNNRQFADYGGRGITVCEQWRGQNGFAAFLLDMGKRPVGMTIDREDNNGNYEPRNCRWATRQQQQRNTRRSLILEVNGERRPLPEWAEIFGMTRIQLYQRLRYGTQPQGLTICQR